MRTTLFALAVLAAPLGAFAQEDTRDARLEVAREYSARAMEDMDMGAMIQTMYQPIVDQARAAGQTVSEDQIERLDALYQEVFAPEMQRIMEGQPEIMADLFTLPELEALSEFYASDVGRSVMTKMPQVMQSVQPEIMTMVERTMPTVIPQVMQILQGG